MSISSSSLSTSSTSTPLLQCPQHTPHADTHDLPALMQLHFMVWHCLSPSLQLQQIPFRRLSGAIQPVCILGLSFLLPSNSHPLQIGSRTEVFRCFHTATWRRTQRECCAVAFSVGGKRSGSILPFDACFWRAGM